MCIRCEGDPQPSEFDSPRVCAFDADGAFRPRNWNCATVDALLDLEFAEHVGDDESIQVIRVPTVDDAGHIDGTNGFIVFTRYKHRGCTSSAMHVGDFWPPKPLTLELAERILGAKP